MTAPIVSERDRRRAEHCRTCLVCSRARKKQRGAAYWFVRNVEARVCPFCRAYERVYGLKAYEPAPAET